MKLHFTKLASQIFLIKQNCDVLSDQQENKKNSVLYSAINAFNNFMQDNCFYCIIFIITLICYVKMINLERLIPFYLIQSLEIINYLNL